LSKGGGVITKRKALHDYLRIKTLIHGPLTVYALTTLGQRRVELDHTNLHVEVSKVVAVRALAYRTQDVTRVDYIPDIQREMQQMGILDVEDPNRPVQFVGDVFPYPLVCSDDDDAAPGATYSGVRNDPGEQADDGVPQIGVTPGYEIEVSAPVLFTVVMKVAGVEKARVTAKSSPGS
jgi:hypothetical protein